MALYDVWIGDLDDPNLNWDGGNWNLGNVPLRLGPLFPYPPPFSHLIDAIRGGTLAGRQTDWAGWVAKCNKDEIKEFIAASYAGDPNYETRGSPFGYLYDQMHELLSFVESLNGDRCYALVAAER
jgi:hypothetical protein